MSMIPIDNYCIRKLRKFLNINASKSITTINPLQINISNILQQKYIFQNKNPAIPETFFLEGKKGEGFRNKNYAFILYFLL